MSRFLFSAASPARAISLTVLALSTLAAQAQDTSSGAIRGTVADASGSLVPAAPVVLVNANTGFRYSGLSDAEGRFAFDLLPPGDYTARVTAAGMSAQLTPKMHVAVGGTLEVNFKLTVAGSQETVTVLGEPALVETQPSAVSSLIEEHAITGLPLNGRRFSDLALLTPGVTQDPRGLTSGSNGDLAFGGIRGFQSSYLVDGGDNNNAFFGQATGRYRAPYQFSSEVVQEFRVSSNTYGAETGRSGGAVINVITKSGSNQFHGTDFYYIRDSAFAAKHAFMTSKPHDQQQQLGFTFGGPIKRNRAFFFAGFDQHIFHIPTEVQFLNGTSTIVPIPGRGVDTPGDYEATDAGLVFAAAQRLDTIAGAFPAKLLGNAGFAKADFTLSPRNTISMRVSSSRYYGSNNVFLDPGSPLTTFARSDNGTESVATETGSINLTSGVSPRIVSHLRAQFTHDLQQSASNSDAPLTRISDEVDGFGRSSILPRQTREHRFHLAETLSLEGNRNSFKLGGDALLTWIYNFFPHSSGGEYIFDPIKVDAFTFAPEEAGLQLTPLRAYAHDVPKYYIQDFGSAISHPDTNEYAAFLQDTIRVTNHFALSLGGRYDVQTFSKKGMVANPLWLGSGRMPFNPYNFAPRAGFAYSLGRERPWALRGGYGLFYTRIPQIYQSTIASDNGLTGTTLFLNNSKFYDHGVFPHYPYALINCAPTATSCTAPEGLKQFTQTVVSSFSPSFKTPHVEQSSLSVEREMAPHLAAGVSYTFVHGVDLIRARDVNLPPPVNVSYPVYDSAGVNLLGSYTIPSFSTWQLTSSFTCPYPPCINPLARPIPQLGAIDVFESAASSVYHGATLSIHRQMSSGIYFRLAYTYAHAIDDGQDALVAGAPATVQNSYAPNAERGNSVTDQRQRFVFSWITEPKPFGRSQPFLGAIFNDWKQAGVVTIGSGRPVNVTVSGDPNQDGNSSNDRIPGSSRNSFLGPDYATTDVRLARVFFLSDHLKLEVLGEAFNALNRDNRRVDITDGGLQSHSVSFIQNITKLGIAYYPGHYQIPRNLTRATNAFAPRQIQFGMKLIY